MIQQTIHQAGELPILNELDALLPAGATIHVDLVLDHHGSRQPTERQRAAPGFFKRTT